MDWAPFMHAGVCVCSTIFVFVAVGAFLGDLEGTLFCPYLLGGPNVLASSGADRRVLVLVKHARTLAPTDTAHTDCGQVWDLHRTAEVQHAHGNHPREVCCAEDA